VRWSDDAPRPGAGAVVALILLSVIMTCMLLACVTATVYSADTITLRRIDASRAELCAPAGNVFARSADGYRLAYDWPGGCAIIGASSIFGGEVYCIQTSPSPPAFTCSEPLPRWWRTVLYLPVVAR
jgi:hypothetical protein